MQLADDLERGRRRDRAGVVDGGVAELADQVQLLRDARPGPRLERRVIDPGGEIVAVGESQPQHLVEVADQFLDRPPTVEAG